MALGGRFQLLSVSLQDVPDSRESAALAVLCPVSVLPAEDQTLPGDPGESSCARLLRQLVPAVEPHAHLSWCVQCEDGGRKYFTMDDGATLFIDLLQLVEFHQINKGILPVCLKHPCVCVAL